MEMYEDLVLDEINNEEAKLLGNRDNMKIINVQDLLEDNQDFNDSIVENPEFNPDLLIVNETLVRLHGFGDIETAKNYLKSNQSITNKLRRFEFLDIGLLVLYTKESLLDNWKFEVIADAKFLRKDIIKCGLAHLKFLQHRENQISYAENHAIPKIFKSKFTIFNKSSDFNKLISGEIPSHYIIKLVKRIPPLAFGEALSNNLALGEAGERIFTALKNMPLAENYTSSMLTNVAVIIHTYNIFGTQLITDFESRSNFIRQFGSISKAAIEGILKYADIEYCLYILRTNKIYGFTDDYQALDSIKTFDRATLIKNGIVVVLNGDEKYFNTEIDFTDPEPFLSEIIKNLRKNNSNRYKHGLSRDKLDLIGVLNRKQMERLGHTYRGVTDNNIKRRDKKIIKSRNRFARNRDDNIDDSDVSSNEGEESEDSEDSGPSGGRDHNEGNDEDQKENSDENYDQDERNSREESKGHGDSKYGSDSEESRNEVEEDVIAQQVDDNQQRRVELFDKDDSSIDSATKFNPRDKKILKNQQMTDQEIFEFSGDHNDQYNQGGKSNRKNKRSTNADITSLQIDQVRIPKKKGPNKSRDNKNSLTPMKSIAIDDSAKNFATEHEFTVNDNTSFSQSQVNIALTKKNLPYNAPDSYEKRLNEKQDERHNKVKFVETPVVTKFQQNIEFMKSTSKIKSKSKINKESALEAKEDRLANIKLILTRRSDILTNPITIMKSDLNLEIVDDGNRLTFASEDIKDIDSYQLHTDASLKLLRKIIRRAIISPDNMVKITDSIDLKSYKIFFVYNPYNTYYHWPMSNLEEENISDYNFHEEDVKAKDSREPSYLYVAKDQKKKEADKKDQLNVN